MFISFLISDVGICRFSRSSMLPVWIPSLTLVVMIMKGLIFQPCVLLHFVMGYTYLLSFV